MGKPAAKFGDKVVGVDIHIIMIPALPAPPVPTPLPHPFNGTISEGCSTNVNIQGKAAALVGSKAKSVPPHIPQGGPFQKAPNNEGEITVGSLTVFINNKAAARMGDVILTCNDPAPAPTCQILPVGPPTVLIG